MKEKKGKSALCRQLRNISTIFATGLPQGSRNDLTAQTHTHTHPLIRTPSEEADPFAAVQLDIHRPFSTSAVRRSSDAGDCFDKLTYFCCISVVSLLVKFTAVEWKPVQTSSSIGPDHTQSLFRTDCVSCCCF